MFTKKHFFFFPRIGKEIWSFYSTKQTHFVTVWLRTHLAFFRFRKLQSLPRFRVSGSTSVSNRIALEILKFQCPEFRIGYSVNQSFQSKTNSTKTINCLGLDNYGKIGNFADLVNLLVIDMKHLLWLLLELYARPQASRSDEHLISPYCILHESVIEVTRK